MRSSLPLSAASRCLRSDLSFTALPRAQVLRNFQQSIRPISCGWSTLLQDSHFIAHPAADSAYGVVVVILLMVGCTVLLLYLLKRFRWF